MAFVDADVNIEKEWLKKSYRVIHR